MLIKLNRYQEPMPSFYHESIGSYSQYKEDLIIDAILAPKEKGFYVDIGANHPELLSNTKRFYDKGWNGINIEPIVTNFQLFEQMRTRDVNLNVGAGSSPGKMNFYHSTRDGGVYSGFDKKNVLGYVKEEEITTTIVPILRLDGILSQYLPEGTTIDFLSIDVEGYEIEVLMGNDWSKYRPQVIIIEFGRLGKQIVKFLEDKGYSYVFSNGSNGIFKF